MSATGSPPRPSGRIGALLASVAHYGLATAVSGLVGLAVVPVYTRVLGADGYGVLEILVTLFTLATGMLIMGLDSGVAILMPEAHGPLERRRLVGTAYGLAAAGAGVGIVIFVGLGASVGPHLLGAEAGGLLAAGAIVTALTLLENVGLASLRNLARSKAYLAVSLASGAGVLLVGLPLVLAGAGPGGAVAGLAAGAAAGAAVAAWSLRDLLPGSFGTRRARTLLVVGLPLVPASLAAWIVSVSDRLLLLPLAGLADVGLYGAAARIALVPNLGISAFMLGWLPFALRIQRAPSAPRLYAVALSLFVAAAGIATLLAVPLGGLVLGLVSGPTFAPAGDVIWLLVGSAFAYGTYVMLNLAIMIARRTALIGFVTGLAAVANIGANLILIPPFGYLGAGIATLTAYLVSASTLFVLGQRTMRLPYDIPYLLGATAVGLGGATLAALIGDPVARWATVLVAGIVLLSSALPRLRTFLALLEAAEHEQAGEDARLGRGAVATGTQPAVDASGLGPGS